jgi:hydroxymethylbilane synthase
MSVSWGSVLRLGTRGSALALAQTEWVAQRLRTAGMEVRIVQVRTVGDAYSVPVTDIGIGVFVSALREALASPIHWFDHLVGGFDPPSC